jgi:hypothetical protein
MPGLPRGPIPSGFLTKSLHAFYPLIVIDLLILISGEEQCYWEGNINPTMISTVIAKQINHEILMDLHVISTPECEKSGFWDPVCLSVHMCALLAPD